MLITLASWRAAFIVPGIVCLVVGAVLWVQIRQGKVGDRAMPQAKGTQVGRRDFWRVFSVLSVTMALEGVIWQAVMFGAAMVFEVKLAPEISALRDGLASWGVATQIVLWVGLATSMIYVVSGVAQYAMGRRIIDRYPLKATYIVASALQVVAMLALAMGNGYVALLGAIGSAVLSSAAGPIENILIARYTPSRYHGLGFGAKFVVAFGGGAARDPADRLGARDDGKPRSAVPRPRRHLGRDHAGRPAAARQRARCVVAGAAGRAGGVGATSSRAPP